MRRARAGMTASDVLLRQLGAEGVAFIGSVRDQAGQRCVGSSFHQGLGAVEVLAARHSQAQGTTPSIR